VDLDVEAEGWLKTRGEELNPLHLVQVSDAWK